MNLQAYQLIAIVTSLFAVGVVVELIRRRKIQEVLWLPWLAAGILPAVLGAWTTPWATFARWLGILYEPLLLVALAALGSFAMLLYLTVVISGVLRKNLRLAQEIALLRYEIEQLRGTSEAPDSLDQASAR
jgi:hypothetical protein